MYVYISLLHVTFFRKIPVTDIKLTYLEDKKSVTSCYKIVTKVIKCMFINTVNSVTVNLLVIFKILCYFHNCGSNLISSFSSFLESQTLTSETPKINEETDAKTYSKNETLL